MTHQTKTKAVDAEILAPPVSAGALTTTGNGPGPALLPSRLAACPNLAAALVKAVIACKPVAHDARNEHHRYNYTSSEAIIEEARNALSANGLAVVPVAQHVNGHEREGADRFELVQQRLLIHTSGESLLCTSAWPITPGAGRPLDKATAAADTLSLSYFLRDLLQMPRIDHDDEVAARDDTKPQRASRPAQKAAAAAPAKPSADKEPPKSGTELVARLADMDHWLLRKGLARGGELHEQIKGYGEEQGYPEKMQAWTGEQAAAGYAWARDWIQRRQNERKK